MRDVAAEPLDARTLNLTLDLSLRVGEVLLSSGAGAADVTATMQSLARHLGMRHPEIDVTFTSLSMSYQADPAEPPIVQIRQVKQRDIDYDDGFWEAEATNAANQPVELRIEPTTGKVLREKLDD